VTPLVVLVHRAAWEDRYQAVTLAVTAAAHGEPVTVALFFAPLRLWVAGDFDEGAPPTAAAARVTSLRATLDEGRRELGLRVVACETAVRLAGLDPAVAAAALDALEPLPSIWRRAREGRVITI
jgi:peroxiredoxin family protein